MISVIICVYKKDCPVLFRKSLNSVFNQSLLPSEVVLCIDGELTKELTLVVSDFSKKNKLIVVKNKQSLGHGQARMVALKKTTNNIVAVADSDDISRFNRFKIQYEFLLSNKVSIVGSSIQEFSGDLLLNKRVVPVSHDNIIKFAKYRCPFNQMTVMFRKEDVMSVGGYVDFFNNEDYFLWYRLIKSGFKLANVSNILVDAHVNLEFIKRRRGWKYYKSEIKLKKIFYKDGFINRFDYLFQVIIRFVFQIILSEKILKLIYNKWLRK